MRAKRRLKKRADDELKRSIRFARFRLFLNRLLRATAWSFLAAFATFAILVVCDRLFALEWSWQHLLVYVSAAAMVVSIAWSLFCISGAYAAAAEIDRRLALKERASSAIFVQKSKDPMAQLVVQDTLAHVRKADVRRAFRLVPPRLSLLALLLLALGLSLAQWMPSLGLLAKRRAEEAQQKEQEDAREAVTLLKSRIEEKRQAMADADLEEAEKLMGEIERMVAESFNLPSMNKKEALLNLSKLGDNVKQETPAEKMDALKKALRKMAQDSRSPLNELRESLRKGEFGEAVRQLEKLKKKLAGGDMSDEESKELSAQMNALSEALGQLATPADLAERLGREDLTDEQKQAIQERMDALKESLASLDKMSDLLESLSQKLAEGGDMENVLSDLDSIEYILQELDASQLEAELIQALLEDIEGIKDSLSECAGGTCLLGKSGSALSARRRLGPGMRGAGWGEGGEAEVKPHETDTFKTRAKGKLGPGKAISWFISGDEVREEAKTPYYEAVSSAEREATDALARETIPRAYEEKVKDYFDSISGQQE